MWERGVKAEERPGLPGPSAFSVHVARALWTWTRGGGWRRNAREACGNFGAGNFRKRRLVVCACARLLLDILGSNPRAVALIEAAERYADASDGDTPARWKAVVAARSAFRKFFRKLAAEARIGPGGSRRYRAADAVYLASEAGIERAAALFARITDALRGKPITPGLTETAAQMAICRDVFGNPFRPVTFSPSWRTDTVVSLARGMYDSRDFGAMPILADALQDAGCDEPTILDHCRAPGEHVRGCWVIDLVLGKE